MAIEGQCHHECNQCAEIDVTREKLKVLKTRFEDVQRDTTGDAHVRELTLRSLKKLINQLSEELTRSKSHADVRSH